MWLDVPKPALDLMRASGVNPAEAIHSAQHAFLNRFALSIDLKTECKPPEKEYKAAPSQRKRPARCVCSARDYKSVARANLRLPDLFSTNRLARLGVWPSKPSITVRPIS